MFNRADSLTLASYGHLATTTSSSPSKAAMPARRKLRKPLDGKLVVGMNLSANGSLAVESILKETRSESNPKA